MAPLVPPPPVISLEEAKEIEKKLIAMGDDKPVLKKQQSRGLLSMVTSADPRADVKRFSGKEFVEWAVKEKVAKDEESAVKIGQALLQHRLAHHWTDDAEFENNGDQYYSFISQEPIEVKMMHAALGQYIAQPEIFYQTKLELRSKTLFGSERWTSVYGVLDDAGSKPRMIHFFKRFSAASAPIESYAVEDCMCSLEECLDCKTDWYCFSLKAKKRSTGKEVTIVACADHSKRLEGWLAALMDAGVTFTKEEEGADLGKVKSIFELSARRINSQEIVPFSSFKGKVCLVVNVASK